MEIYSAQANSVTPSTQKTSGSTQGADRPHDFFNILREMSDSGDISFDETSLDALGTDLFDSGIILPSPQNAAMLAQGMDELLNDLYRENGLSKNPPVELKYSYAENKVKVFGDRDDTAQIEELINSDPDMKEYTRSFLAISSHVVAIQESLQFQEEYRASNGSDEIIRKYSHLFNDNRKHPEVSYMFGSESSLLADGQLFSWMGGE